MKKQHLLGALCACMFSLVISTTSSATTALYPVDGDINFVVETGTLGGLTLAIFDEEADIGSGPSLEVTTPELIFWDFIDELSDADANTLTIDGDFVLAVSNGVTWIGGDINYSSDFTAPEANAYAIKFGDLTGFELVIDVNPVPIPAAVWLFGSGLLGLVGLAKRKKAA